MPVNVNAGINTYREKERERGEIIETDSLSPQNTIRTRVLRIEKHKAEQTTSNDKYDGIKTSIMDFFFSFLSRILLYILFLHHTFSLSTKWLVVTFSVALPVSLLLIILSVLHNWRFFFFIQLDSTNIFILNEWKSRHYVGILFHNFISLMLMNQVA